MSRSDLRASLVLAALLLVALFCQAEVQAAESDSGARLSSNVQTTNQNRILLQEMGGASEGGGGMGRSTDYLVPIHGWLMSTAFAIIFPLGIALPLIFKGTRWWPALFWLHVLVQILGALFITAGLALGAKLNINNSEKHVHRAIGISVFALVWIQGLVALASRPFLHGKAKGLYNVLHWWGGRTALLVGIGNAYYGMDISGPAARYIAGYSVALGGWILIALFGQLIVHALYRYDYKGRVVLVPDVPYPEEKATKAGRHSTYLNAIAEPRDISRPAVA